MSSNLLASTPPSSYQAGKPVTAEPSSYPIRTASGSSSSSSSGASVGLQAYCIKAIDGRALVDKDCQLGSTVGAAAAAAAGGGAAGAGAVIEAVAVGDVQDNGDGTYTCSFTHNAAGTYELHVTNGRQGVAAAGCEPNSPSFQKLASQQVSV